MTKLAIAPGLRDAGFGTLSYNFRGQAESELGESTELSPRLMVDDLIAFAESL
jgi:hypothetical protein